MNALERAQIAWRHYDGPLSHVAVLLAVVDHTDLEGRAFPSEKRIALAARVSERTVRDALKELDRRGVVKREPRSQGRLTVYTVVDAVLLASPHVLGDECHCHALTGNPRQSPATGNGCRSSGEEEPIERQKPSSLTGNSLHRKKTSEVGSRAARARGISAELRAAVKRHGRHRGREARGTVSAPAAAVIDKVGWSTLCDSTVRDFDQLVAGALGAAS